MTASRRAISIRSLVEGLPGPWQPRDVVRVNDAIVRLVVPEGTRRRPVAETTAHALLLERPETEQYGRSD